MRYFLTRTLLAAILCTLSVVPALAQTFPSRTVTMVMPYPPGGTTDTLARALAFELGKLWSQPVVVENLPGGGTVIGASKVANAPADGHTLLFTIDPTVVSNRFLYKKLPYDPDKSLIPITMVARSALLVLANLSFPVSNLREVVEAARRAPGKVAYSSIGIGTSNHLIFESIAKREGVQFLHVPYKGIAQATTAALTGDVQVTAGTMTGVAPLVRAGRAKVLAISGGQRSSLFPDIPTLAESGYGYADSVIWFGVFAPAGTGARLVDRIYRDVTTVAKRPEFMKKHIAALNLDLVANTPAEFAAEIRADVKTVGEMVKAAGVQPE